MDKIEKGIAAYANVLTSLFIPDIDGKSKDEYTHVELDPVLFGREMMALRERIKYDNSYIQFVDVGCGIGTKLLLAKQFVWWKLYGIEITDVYLEVAKKKLFGGAYNDTPTFILDNAINRSYAWYDVVYFYRPLKSDKKQMKLERQIHNTMKSGAYLLMNLGMYGPAEGYYTHKLMPDDFKLIWDNDDIRFGHYIYQKQ